MIIDFHNLNGGGGGGTAEYATSAGTSNKSKLLLSESSFPQSANTGDVVAIGTTPSRGTKGGTKSLPPSTGVYQYDGSNWNKIETETPDFTSLKPVSELPESGETGEVIALSTPPQEGTWEVFDASEHPTKVRILTRDNGTYLLHFDNDNLYTGLDYTAGNPPTFNGWGWGLQPDDTYEWHYDNNGYYISVSAEEEDGDWYIYAEMTQGEGGFSMLDAYELGSASEMYVSGAEGNIGVYQYDGADWNQIGSGEGSSAYKIELSTTNPDDFTEGDIVNLNAFFAAVMENPSTIDGAYIFLEDGNIYHISSASYNERSGEGEFNFVISYPNWIESLTIGFEMAEFSFAETHIWQGSTLVPTTDFPQDPAYGEIVNYDDGEGNVGLYQYDADNDEWVPFGGGDNTSLMPVSELPDSGELGEVVCLGNYIEREPTSADVFTSATVTMVDGRATFKMYNPNYGGYCDEHIFGYDVNEGIISDWGGEGDVIPGPWNDHGVEFSISGNDITFTTQNPEDTEEALKMWGFDPNLIFITKEVGIYQYDGDAWNKVGENGGDSGDAVYKIATTEDAVSGEVGTTFVDRLPVETEEVFEGGEDDRGHNFQLKRVFNVDYGETGTGEGGFSFSYYILPNEEGYFTVDDSINCELSIDNTGDGYDWVVTLHKIVGEEEVESDELIRETFDFDDYYYSTDILLPSWCLNFGEGYPQMSDIYLHVYVNSSSNNGEYEVTLIYLPDGLYDFDNFNLDNDLKRFSFSSGETNTGIFENLESYKAYIDYKAPAEWNRKLQIVSNERSDVATFNLKPNEHVHYRILDGKDLWGTADDPYASVEDEVPQVGDMCFDTSDGCLYVWVNNDWQEIYNSGGIM